MHDARVTCRRAAQFNSPGSAGHRPRRASITNSPCPPAVSLPARPELPRGRPRELTGEKEFYTSDPTANRSQPGPQGGTRPARGTDTDGRAAGPTRHPLLPIPLGTFHSPPSLPFRSHAGAAYPSLCAPTIPPPPLYNPRSPRAHAPSHRPAGRRGATAQRKPTRAAACAVVPHRPAPSPLRCNQATAALGRRGLRPRTVLAQAERGRRGARDRG
ncbi:hypothetical protein PVAP13_5KG661107 [Panicum virgatum]|uniref:Uncharacterized protein n=1 Tax=Panicum virgatum TaxID=38727 RepID=A0A8T0STW0_PANVG|nr:hypothetical protein PVAP13_5KG661107 [Panicum virgatum]